MATRLIDNEEWYPVLSLSNRNGYARDEVDIDDELSERWDTMMREFDAVQELLAPIFEATLNSATR